MSGANGTAARESRGAGDSIIVVATIAFAIGLAGVAAGLDLLGAVPLSNPAATIENGAIRMLDARVPAPPSPPPAVAPLAAHGETGRKQVADTPWTVVNGETVPTESRGDPRQDLMEMGRANRQRGVTRHQAAIGHAYAP